MSKDAIRSLIQTVFQHGQYIAEGTDAIKRLVEFGEPALVAMIEALDNPPPSDLHPRDLWESIHYVFSGFARTILDSLIDALERGDLQPGLAYSALGDAKGPRAVDSLVRGLQDPDPNIRWVAAGSLVRHRSKRAVPAVLRALRDRSSLVQSTIVFAMSTNKMYRRPEALPALDRIIASKAIQKHSPGTWKKAVEVRQRICLEATGSGRTGGHCG